MPGCLGTRTRHRLTWAARPLPPALGALTLQPMLQCAALSPGTLLPLDLDPTYGLETA